jgi:DNA-binding SARP family transcriptional activator/ABC-type transport system substrate-binding protein
MEFGILGPLDVRANGAALSVGGPRQRALLALLLLSANRVVSRDRLVQELWPDQPADGLDHALTVRVSRLRKALDPQGSTARLLTRPPGYLLRVEPGELDLQRFEELVAAGREALGAGDRARAADCFREADSLWRGRPLADLEFEPFARLEVERLEELRLAAVEERIDAELELGRHGALIAELEALVAKYPLRERLRAQLMRALYANARQAEALSVYSDTRRLLVDELGIEPSEELRELERRILNQDPELVPRSEPRAVPDASTPDPSPQRRVEGDQRPAQRRWARRRVVIPLAALTIAAVLAATVPLSSGGHPGSALRLSSVGAVAFLDAQSGRLIGQLPTGPDAGIMRAWDGSFWKLEESGDVLQIDARTMRLIRTIPVGLTGGDIAVGEGGVWISGSSQMVARIDPQYGIVAQRIALPTHGPSHLASNRGIAVGDGSLWVVEGLSRVVRLDPATGRVEHSFNVPDAAVLAFGDGELWIGEGDLGTLVEVDPRTNTIIATARVGPSDCCLAVGGGYAWAATDTGIWQISPNGEPVAETKLPTGAGEIFFGAGALWATAGGTVIRIDAQAGAVSRYRFGHTLTGIATDGRRVAVDVFASPVDATAGLSGAVLNVGFSTMWWDNTDPAVAAAPGVGTWPIEQQLQNATCARLLTYPDAPAPRGWQLIPEVAERLPTVSPDGRTYTFTIRPGFRFSPPSNAAVTAQTFKYSIERALSPQLGTAAPAASLASDIVGVDAYRGGTAEHISGISASGDTLVITLKRRAPDFPERIAATYFCPVPIGTPIIAGGVQNPIPSAGPYYLSYNGGGVIGVLRRNPNYRGTRPQRLAAVVFRDQIPLGDVVARIEAGKEDYAAGQGAALAPDSVAAARFGQPASARSPHYFLTPLLGTDQLLFTARHGLLADPSVRRAVNFALDRPALAAALGDLVTDQYLPPGIPGFRTDRQYPLEGPEPSRARTLMHGRTGEIHLAVCGEPGCLDVGRIVAADLQQIGIAVKLRRSPGDIASPSNASGGDLVLTRAFAPYPDPVAFLKASLGTTVPQERLDALTHLDRTRRLADAATLEQQLLRNRAPAAAFGTPAIPEFFSARVDCTTFVPTSFGVDLGAICLHAP